MVQKYRIVSVAGNSAASHIHGPAQHDKRLTNGVPKGCNEHKKTIDADPPGIDWRRTHRGAFAEP